MATKKIKVKVKTKKLNLVRTIIFICILLCIIFSVAYLLHLPVKNIYITGNNIIKDKEIIEQSGLEKYPPFINTYFINLKNKILKNDYIKNVKIKRKIFNKIYIEVEEYKPVAIYKDKIILSNKKQVKNNNSFEYLPYITNNIDSIYDEFVESFSKVDNNVLAKISHIEYSPNEVDKERFVLYMIDSNYVYITLSKINKVNKYNSILKELDNKKGIIYLDSGDYVEIKG